MLILLDELDTQISVVNPLDVVSNTADYDHSSILVLAKDQNDSTYSARDGRTEVNSRHEDHLDELGSLRW